MPKRGSKVEARAEKRVSQTKTVSKPQPFKPSGSVLLDVMKGVNALDKSIQKTVEKNTSPVVKDTTAKTVGDMAAAIKAKGQNLIAKAVETQIGMEMRHAVKPTPESQISPQMKEYLRTKVDFKKLEKENQITLKQGGMETPLMEITPEGDDTKKSYLQKYLNQRGSKEGINLNSLTLEATKAEDVFKQDRIKFAPDSVFFKRLNGLIDENTDPKIQKNFEKLLFNKGVSSSYLEKNLSNTVVSEYDDLLTPEEKEQAIERVIDLYNKKGKEKGEDFGEFAGESIIDEVTTAGMAPIFGGVKKLKKLGPIKEWPGFIKDAFNKQKKLNQKSAELQSALQGGGKINPANAVKAEKPLIDYINKIGDEKLPTPEKITSKGILNGENKLPSLIEKQVVNLTNTPFKKGPRNLNTRIRGLEGSPNADAMEAVKVPKPYVSQNDVKVMVGNKTYSSDDIINLAQGIWDNPKTTAVSLETQEIVKQSYYTSMKTLDDITKKLAVDPGNETLLKEFGEMSAKNYELSNAVSLVNGVAGRALSLQKTTPNNFAPDENFRKATSSVLKNLPKEEAIKLNQKLLLAKSDPAAFQKIMEEYTKTTWKGKLSEYMMAAMLSNPKTHIKNIMGTLVNVTSNIARIPIEAGIDATRSILTGKDRTVFLKELPAAIKSLTNQTPKAAMDAGRDIVKMFKGQTIQQVKQGDLQNMPQIKGTIGNIIRAPLNMLAVEDKFFKSLVKSMETARFDVKASKGLKMAPSKVEKAIDDNVLAALFQSDLGKPGKLLTSLANESFLVKLNFPFLKTPINIIKEGLKHTPLGFVNAAFKKNAEFPKEMAKAILGTAASIPMVMYALGENDDGLPNITGPAPFEEAERDAFYRSGQIPYSIRFGNTYYSYKDVEPFSFLFSGAAAASSNYKTNGELDTSIVSEIASGMARTFGDKSSMRTIGEISEAFLSKDESEEWGDKMVKFGFSKVGQFIPNVIAATGRGMDPNAREPAGGLENFKALIPGMSKDIASKTDLFGNEVMKKNGFLGQTLLPLTSSKVELNVLDQELMRLKSPVGPPSKVVMGVSLNKKAYNQMKVARGQTLQNQLWNAMNSEVYAGMNDSQRSEALKQIESNIDKTTSMLFFVDNPELLEESFLNNKKNQVNLFKEMVPLLDPEYRGMSEGQLEDFINKNLDDLNANFQTSIDNGELRKNLLIASEVNL